MTQVYILMFQGSPLGAFTRWERADEEMAHYTAKQQKEMTVTAVNLVNDD